MAESEYYVFIRNGEYEVVETLTDWLSFKMVRTFNDVGRFTLTVAADSPAAPVLTRNSGVIVVRRNRFDDLDRDVIFSGSATTSYTRTATTITLSGTDDMAVLENRCRPTPGQNTGPFPDEFFVQSGQASAVLIELAMDQIGITAPVDWRIPEFTANADPALGGTIQSQCNLGDRIIDVMASLAVSPVAGGLGFTVLHAEDYSANIELQIYEPRDRTAEALFSIGGGTLQDFEDEIAVPQANYFYLGDGSGVNADRVIIEGGNTASITEVGRRISTFVDARGIDDPTLLAQRLTEVINGAVISRQVKLVPFQIQSLEYGRDWELGDLVRFVDADGNNVDRVVRGLEIELDPKRGAVITPTIGDAGLAMTSHEVQHIESVQRRVAYLEANYRLPEIIAASGAGVGSGRIQFGPTASAGWLLCQGQAVSRTTYALLFGVIGTGYGAGNGSTTFNLPDMRGRFPIGNDGSSFPLTTTGGATTTTVSGTLTHDYATPNGGVVFESGSGSGNDLDTTVNLTHGGSDKVARDQHTHQPPGIDDHSVSIGSVAILPPYRSINWEVFTGVV